MSAERERLELEPTLVDALRLAVAGEGGRRNVLLDHAHRAATSVEEWQTLAVNRTHEAFGLLPAPSVADALDALVAACAEVGGDVEAEERERRSRVPFEEWCAKAAEAIAEARERGE